MAFGTGFFGAGQAALGQMMMASNQTGKPPDSMAWMMFAFAVMLGGFLGVSGKNFNRGQDARVDELKAQGVAEAIADPAVPVVAVPPKTEAIVPPDQDKDN